jgi:DNA polymerase-1
MWEAVLAEYKRQELDEKYALTQARLARILRASDWDNKKKKPILWSPNA